jgi:hypothetical protein
MWHVDSQNPLQYPAGSAKNPLREIEGPIVFFLLQVLQKAKQELILKLILYRHSILNFSDLMEYKE